MFGYLIANAGTLTPDEIKRYKSCYCGLCRCLKEEHGEISRLALNYDMTFLVLLLQSLYEPVEKSETFRCLAHPMNDHLSQTSAVTSYAADMLVALTRFKCLDDWHDDTSLIGAAGSSFFKRDCLSVKERYPRQYSAIEQGIFNLSAIEKRGDEDPDACARCFGEMLGTIFVMNEDRWSPQLFSLGDNLGRFIYLVDAMVDLDRDTLHNSFNPFRRYYGRDNADMFRSILRIFLSGAVDAFDALPLVQDVSILKNILCSGLWAVFEEKYGSIQNPGR